MNKKGIEGLPLKYLIIVLFASLVIGIVLEFTGTLKTGVSGAVTEMSELLGEKVSEVADTNSPPEIKWVYLNELQLTEDSENPVQVTGQIDDALIWVVASDKENDPITYDIKFYNSTGQLLPNAKCYGTFISTESYSSTLRYKIKAGKTWISCANPTTIPRPEWTPGEEVWEVSVDIKDSLSSTVSKIFYFKVVST